MSGSSSFRFIRVDHRIAHRLSDLGQTPDPEPWVAEVEAFVFGSGLLRALRQQDVMVLMLEAESIVGVFSHSSYRESARYLNAVLVGVGHRGHGVGSVLFQAAIEDAASLPGVRHVAWVVANDNKAMMRLARKVDADPTFTTTDGQWLFVSDV